MTFLLFFTHIFPFFVPVLIVAWCCWLADRRAARTKHLTLYPHPYKRR